MHFSDTFDTFDKILFLIIIFTFFSPFVKTGVMIACFKTDGNLQFLTDLLKLKCRNSTYRYAFSLICLVGVSVSWHVLDVPKSIVLIVVYIEGIRSTQLCIRETEGAMRKQKEWEENKSSKKNLRV